MIPATPQEQADLYALQQVDSAIRQLQLRRANLPEQKALDENAEMLSRITADYAQRSERLATLERQQRRHEEEIATVESRRKSEDNRMYSGAINSEKELEALRAEVSSLKARKRDLEDVLLEVMEEIEELQGTVGSLKERHTELTAKVDELTAARDEAAREIDGELAELQAQREKATAAVPEEIRQYYEDLRARKGDLAVAVLEGTTCTGCHLQLTPIELEELRDEASRKLSKCPQCDRVLVLH